MLFLRRFGSTREGGSLVCPACRSNRVRFVENLGCQMEQWRCGMPECGQKFRYQRRALPQDMSASELRDRPELVLGNRGPRLNFSQLKFLRRITKGA